MHGLRVGDAPPERRDAALDDVATDRRKRDEKTDGGHDLGRVGRGGERPEYRHVQQQTEQRAKDDDDEQEGRDDGPSEASVQLVVEQRRIERDSAIREIEDAGRGIRHRQTGRDERIDRAGAV